MANVFEKGVIKCNREGDEDLVNGSDDNSIPFYSILFYTFIALNLCKADSKAQHQKSSLRNHLSIAVAKSSTTETPDRVYAKVGMPCGRDMILTFS